MKFKIQKCLFIIAIAVSAAAGSVCAEAPLPINNPDALIKIIEHASQDENAQKQLSVRFDSALDADAAMSQFFGHLEKGTEQWLALAATLHKCRYCLSDGYSDMLSLSESFGLEHNPEAVLRHEDISALEKICRVPTNQFIKETYDTHMKALKVAVEHTNDLALQEKKAACLKLIDSAPNWAEQIK